MATIAVNGVTYFYHVRGTGPPLLLLHGFTGSSENWLDIEERLAAAHQVITLDLLGHGRTESPADHRRYRMEQAARDLTTLLDTLNLTTIDLLGYSMGGRLALYLAARYPGYLRGLIIESASPGLASAIKRQARIEADNRLAKEMEEQGIAHFVDKWQRLALFATQAHLPDEKRERLRRQRQSNKTRGLANSLRGMGTGQQPSLWPELKRIQLPALVLAGALDQKYASLARQMKEELPLAELQIFPNAGHNIHFERPQDYTRAVLGFLARLK